MNLTRGRFGVAITRTQGMHLGLSFNLEVVDEISVCRVCVCVLCRVVINIHWDGS